MKKFKRLLAVVLASTLMSSSFGYLGTTTVYAEEAVDVEDKTGFEEMTEIVLDDSEMLVESDEKYSHADVTSSAYTKYTNDYFYNQLSSTEKAFYNKAFMVCQNLLISNNNATYYSGGYGTETLSYSGMTEDEALRVAWIMLYSNPQFYFVSSQYYHSASSSVLAFGVYSEFASGASRAQATSKLFSIVEKDLQKVNAQSTTYAKQKMAHDLVCLHTNYDLNSSVNQGAYSVFVNGSSVCAGYAEAFAMLCNAAGIQTVCVTSSEHEWNLIQLNNTWYYVDCTWDDGDDQSTYDKLFLDCGSKTIATYDNLGYHTMESKVWSGVYPTLSYADYSVTNSDISGYVAPTIADVSGTSASTTPQTVASQVMYRLYNPNSGEHFYTATASEKDNLVRVGWTYEGAAWNAPVSSGIPVYRLYNPNGGDHHYTIDTSERDMLVSVGWTYEGVGWYSADYNKTPLYRLYNPNADTGSHHYTTSISEREMLKNAGWTYEGIAWFGL